MKGEKKVEGGEERRRLWRGVLVYGREQKYVGVIVGNESEGEMMGWEFG